jgi:hypothetical protein
MVFGATGAILSPIFGYLTKYSSQIAFMVFMLMVSIANSIFMLTWVPTQNNFHVIFIMAIAFGLSQSYANGQVRGLFLVHITDNKNVFSIASLFQTFGFFIGFLLSLLTCTKTKTFVYFGLSVLSLICYITLIVRENKLKVDEIIKEQTSIAVDLIDSATNTDNDSVSFKDVKL